MDHVIKSQEQWVLYRLERFYRNPNNLKRVQDILEEKSKISLRIIDWFVTNYSKEFNVSFITKNDNHVIVFLAYKSHLKAYTKRMFDPFCRWKRIKFHGIETNVAQLNFFEWAINEEILDYIEANHEDIYNDMQLRMHDKDNNVEEDTPKKKRHQLSKSATNSLKRHNVRVVVKFN